MMATIETEETRIRQRRRAAGEMLDLRAVAEILGCSTAHLSNVLRGKVRGVPPIPHVRTGRTVSIRRSSLDQWIEAREKASLGGVQ